MEFDRFRYELSASGGSVISEYLTHFSSFLTSETPDIKGVVVPALGLPE